MPFLPEHYTVRRNYARVFQCAFLACFIGHKLVVTDFCRSLADKDGIFKNADDYFFSYIPRFCFPFPAFENYNSSQERIYPFCAVIKFLLSRLETHNEAKASLDDILSFVTANNCTGAEEINFYRSLKPSQYEAADTERRQLREMMIFISQLSILKFYDGCLYLENINENLKREMLSSVLQPIKHLTKSDRIDEFYGITSIGHNIILPSLEALTANPDDIEFTEGNRIRTEHFRIERSTLLRKYYRLQNPEPVCCACRMNMKIRYPWTEYMLEIHHLLPLSSSVSISGNGTLLSDIVGLCPSCHRAVHMFYKKWLRANNQSDFASIQEARDIFLQAASEIVP